MAIDIDDENGLREKYDQIGINQLETIRSAQAQKVALDTLGINWAQQQSVDILKTMAANPGNIASEVGAGLAMGVAAGNTLGSMANKMFSNVSEMNQQTAAVNEDPIEKLTKLKKMLDAGLITQADFDSKKTEILGNI